MISLVFLPHRITFLHLQIASLANEVTEWKDLKAKALEAGQQAAAGAENQIQLTIRYPGESVFLVIYI